METEHIKRKRQIEEIILISEISDDRILCQQLESMSCLQVEVVHTLLVRIAIKNDDSFIREII